MRRVFHRVQMIQVAEEFVEAVNGGQKLVAVAQMVLAELAGGVALRLERGGNRAGFGRQADLGTRLADRGHAGANRQFAGDEVRATRRAAGLGVVVGEQHAFLGHLVEVRRPTGHQAAVVGADVPHADVVAHDEEDVRLLAAPPAILADGVLHLGDRPSPAVGPCLRRSNRAAPSRRHCWYRRPARWTGPGTNCTPAMARWQPRSRATRPARGLRGIGLSRSS